MPGNSFLVGISQYWKTKMQNNETMFNNADVSSLYFKTRSLEIKKSGRHRKRWKFPKKRMKRWSGSVMRREEDCVGRRAVGIVLTSKLECPSKGRRERNAEERVVGQCESISQGERSELLGYAAK